METHQMAQLTETSKNFIKTLSNNAPVDPKDVFRVLNDLKAKLEAHRINKNTPKSRSKAHPNG